MSILPQHKCYLTRSPTQAPWHRKRVICSATTLTPKPKLRPNQPATEPQLVNPPNLVTPVSIPPVLNDPSLQSTWSHRSWVATGCVTVLVPLAKATVGAAHSHIWLEPMLAGYLGFILADLGSGIYHWGIDNYGDGSTPVFGNQIEAFQGHHKWPWTITRRQFANNLHALARAVAFVVLPIDLACDDPVMNAFAGVMAGLLVSRSQHAAHHREPYNSNYCIVSGVWNEFLDKNKFFEAMEMALYFKLGVRPRSWSEPSSDWIEET
uniref:Lipid desaturase domain-containing protein n=1 Tax=Salix viminalis TaxID=40686 RepID=A0A6N2MPB3_SALVM